MSTSESLAVSMMIGTVERVRISRHTSVPGMPGEHQVEQDQVGAAPVELGERGRAVRGDGDVVALALEQEGERLAERVLRLRRAGCGSRVYLLCDGGRDV